MSAKITKRYKLSKEIQEKIILLSDNIVFSLLV